MAKEGVYRISDTKMWSTFNSEITRLSYWDNADFKSEFEKIFSVIGMGQSIQYKELDGSNSTSYDKAIVLADGTYVYVWAFGKNYSLGTTVVNLNGHIYKKVAEFDIDVNGKKGPNQWGRDMFCFLVADNGTLYPCRGRDQYYTDNGTLEGYSNATYCAVDAQKGHNSCAARVMEDGWKMNY